MLLQNKRIDYKILADACAFYTNREYNQVECPWIAKEKYMIMTSPTKDVGFAIGLQCKPWYLVCSAEQGLVQMACNNELLSGIKYFSISPCFRDEIIDETHSKTFMKLELFHISRTHAGAEAVASRFLADAFDFNRRHKIKTTQEQTNIGFDLLDQHGLELGSYGTRAIEGFFISYGTGLALPRFSLAKERTGGLPQSKH